MLSRDLVQVLVSIFVAIMLDYFNDSNYEDGISVKYDDIESFQRKWLEFDVQATSYMRTVDLGLLLYACKPPLVGVHLERPGGDNHSFFNREVRLSLISPLISPRTPTTIFNQEVCLSLISPPISPPRSSPDLPSDLPSDLP